MQELKLLEEDSNIFKLVGPILVKQDPLEATSNVEKRLEFIQGELDRLDSQLKRLQDKQSKRQNVVSSAQLFQNKKIVLWQVLTWLRFMQLQQVEEQLQAITQAAIAADKA